MEKRGERRNGRGEGEQEEERRGEERRGGGVEERRRRRVADLSGTTKKLSTRHDPRQSRGERAEKSGSVKHTYLKYT